MLVSCEVALSKLFRDNSTIQVGLNVETLILEGLVVHAKLDSSFELADFVGVSAPGAIHAMIRPSRRNNIALNADQWRVVKNSHTSLAWLCLAPSAGRLATANGCLYLPVPRSVCPPGRCQSNGNAILRIARRPFSGHRLRGKAH
jgi:hypothetical protein